MGEQCEQCIRYAREGLTLAMLRHKTSEGLRVAMENAGIFDPQHTHFGNAGAVFEFATAYFESQARGRSNTAHYQPE